MKERPKATYLEYGGWFRRLVTRLTTKQCPTCKARVPYGSDCLMCYFERWH